MGVRRTDAEIGGRGRAPEGDALPLSGVLQECRRLVCESVGEAADADRSVYRFDELGWLEFERLAHGLLAPLLGCDEASWVGRADEGRMAFVRGGVPLPGVGLVAGPLLVVIAWGPGVGHERLSARARQLARDAGVLPRCALVITNAPVAMRKRPIGACWTSFRAPSIVAGSEER